MSQFPRLYRFDMNRRVYEMDGVKKLSPYQAGYYVPIEITSETETEYICEYGTINKKKMAFSYGKGRGSEKVFTEKQKDDDVFISENRHKIMERLRSLSADELRKVEEILIQNNC